MILSQREYAAALEQRRRLERARSDYLARPQPDPRMQEALLTSVEAMRGPLEAESAEYEALRHGGVAAFAAPLDALPVVLTRARIAAGLTPRELAARLGTAESAVQQGRGGRLRPCDPGAAGARRRSARGTPRAQRAVCDARHEERRHRNAEHKLIC